MPKKSSDIKVTVAKLLDGVPVVDYVEVELPSRGIGYDSIGENVSIRAITYDDEMAAAKVRGPGFNHINFMLKLCVKDLKLEDMYSFDKVFLIFKLRELTLGKSYKATVSCPNCADESIIVYNLDKVPIKKVPESWTDPEDLLLKSIGKKCKIFCPRVKHEKYLKSHESTLVNLWRFVHSFEGVETREVVSEVIKKMPIPVLSRIIGALTKDFGINSKVKFVCAACHYHQEMEMPFNEDFFTES